MKKDSYSGQGYFTEQTGDFYVPGRNVQEIVEASEREEFDQLCKDLMECIRKFFPKLSAYYHLPDLEQIELNYSYIINLAGENYSNQAIDIKSREFLSAAAIRILDNFIDEVYWPKVVLLIEDPQSKEQVTETMSKFLSQAEEIIRIYDPHISPEIKELPMLELKLALNPDQQTFDREILNYFNRKSYNIAYLRHLVTSEQSQSEELWTERERNKNQLIAAWDISRDLMSVNRQKYDFGVFNHIENNGLNPSSLLEIFKNVLKNNAPLTYGFFENNNLAIDDEDYPWSEIKEFMKQDGLTEIEKFFVKNCLEAIKYLKCIPS